MTTGNRELRLWVICSLVVVAAGALGVWFFSLVRSGDIEVFPPNRDDQSISVRNLTGDPVELEYRPSSGQAEIRPGQATTHIINRADTITPRQEGGQPPDPPGCTTGPVIATSVATGEEVGRLPTGTCLTGEPDRVWYICNETGPRANCPDPERNLAHPLDPDDG